MNNSSNGSNDPSLNSNERLIKREPVYQQCMGLDNHIDYNNTSNINMMTQTHSQVILNYLFINDTIFIEEYFNYFKIYSF